jgi:hypothetical protein
MTVRELVASGEYGQAERAYREYVESLRAAALAGADPAPLLAEARELLDWVRRSVCVARSQAQAEWNQLESRARYLSRPARPTCSITLLG